MIRGWRFLAGALVLAGLAAAAPDSGPAPEDRARVDAALPAAPAVPPKSHRKLLVFTLARGFRHDSIPVAAYALAAMGKRTGAWEAVVSDDPESFAPERLAAFDGVLFASTTGDLFLPADLASLPADAQAAARKRDAELRKSLLAFVRSGKGLAGLHAATDCWYGWPEWGVAIGGWFNGHPWHERVRVALDDPGHPLVAAFGGRSFEVTDEIYTFKAPWSRARLRVLYHLDRSFTVAHGNRPDNDYALAWIRREGSGRVFYSALGHREELYWNPAWLKSVLAGVQYALGDLAADAAPVAAPAGPVPDAFAGTYAGTFAPANGAVMGATAWVVAAAPDAYDVRAIAGATTAAAGVRVDGDAGVVGSDTDEGFVTGWTLGGPYVLPGKSATELFDAPFPPEPTHPAHEHLRWKVLRGQDPAAPWLARLADLTPHEACVAYLRAVVVSDADQDADLLVGSDDGVKAWLNGRLVLARNELRGIERDADRAVVRLASGRNELILKVTQGGGDWAACARIVPKGGARITGVLGTDPAAIRWTGTVAGGTLAMAAAGPQGGTWSLTRVDRPSPTLGAPPPAGAVVLLPFRPGEPPALDAWDQSGWTALPDGSVEVGDGDARTKRSFGDLRLHVEFLIPNEPDGRGQDRGNSGVYVEDRYEIQVLDSFGLDPKPDDCGAVYSIRKPDVNACLPPLRWQAYDLVFRAPRFDRKGTMTRKPVFERVEQNGVLIHAHVEVPRTTGGGPGDFVPAGPLRLQDHGHPVRYRNLWAVPLAN